MRTIPVVAIGGIKEDNLPFFIDTDINEIAVVSAIISQKNITEAAKRIKEKLESIISKD